MFRLSRQTKILSPVLIHRRIWFRGFHDEFIPHGTGNDGTRNDGTRNDGSIKDHGKFKVDIIKFIGELGKELRQSINDGNAGIHKELAELKSDQKVSKWQLHILFIGASSLAIWSLKDYIKFRYPAFFPTEEGTPPL